MDEEKTCETCGVFKYTTEKQLLGHTYHCQKKQGNKEATRKERVPFGKPEQRWGPREPDGFHYRVFNDNWKKEPGRVKRAIAAGYEIVDHEKSGMNVGTNEDGSEIKGVLMRIPDKYYKEDQANKARELDKIDQQIHRGKFDDKLTNTYGGVKVNITKE